MSQMNENACLRKIISVLASNNGWPGNKLPMDYLVLDTETLGLQPTVNRIVQLGFCLVRNGKPAHELWDTDHFSIVLQHDKEAFVGAEDAIKVHGYDYETSQREGICPEEAMSCCCDAVRYADEQRLPIVGHNFYKFDRTFIEMEMGKVGLSCTFDQSKIIDTALIVKAMQIGMLPVQGESNNDYWARVSSTRCKGVYFNLDRYCMDRFQLTKYGAAKEHAHDAGYDCYLTHLVVKELNLLLTSE